VHARVCRRSHSSSSFRFLQDGKRGRSRACLPAGRQGRRREHAGKVWQVYMAVGRAGSHQCRRWSLLALLASSEMKSSTASLDDEPHDEPPFAWQWNGMDCGRTRRVEGLNWASSACSLATNHCLFFSSVQCPFPIIPPSESHSKN
jgi:hypothetical protein